MAFYVNRKLLCVSKSYLNHILQRNIRRSRPSKLMRKMAAQMMAQRLVWVDLEMTGLDINTDHIIEMSCVVTDSDLDVVAEGPHIVIHQSNEVMQRMGAWCVQHHGQSGLTQQVLDSKTTLIEAEMIMLQFVKQHTPPKKCVLAGNSVHADKKFLDKYMPSFMDHLHYRIVDVSSIKELARRWYPCLEAPAKKGSHRAVDDIYESIEELKFYRQNIFR